MLESQTNVVTLRKISTRQLECNLYTFLKIPGLSLKAETEDHTFSRCFNAIQESRRGGSQLTALKLTLIQAQMVWKLVWFALRY